MSNVAVTLGIIEVGVSVSVFLFGLSTIQVYSYHSRFPNDPVKLKLFVYLVWLLELGHVICTLDYFWAVSIVQYGHPEMILGRAPPSMPALFILTGCVATSVQMFFADRVRRVSGKLFWVVACWGLSILRFALSVTICVVLTRVSLADFAADWKWLVTSSWVSGAAVDTLITVLLFYDLFKKRKSAFRKTAKLIDRLILTTIETGLLTSVLTLVSGLSFEVVSGTFAWFALYLCIARVFSNSLLATLNTRLTIRQMAVSNIHSVDFISHIVEEPVVDTLKTRRLQPIELECVDEAGQAEAPSGRLDIKT
ncbi:hypothetical protein EYR38_006111 [Pleurotus pulmonarius]|nr:hypothetical protein EYR38_006111 [Pleurotus pulmonarius]